MAMAPPLKNNPETVRRPPTHGYGLRPRVPKTVAVAPKFRTVPQKKPPSTSTKLISRKRVVPTCPRTTRQSRSFTEERKMRVQAFNDMIRADPEEFCFVEMGSDEWINGLAKFMTEETRRTRNQPVTPADISNWTKISPGFFRKEYVRTFKQSGSGSSPGTDESCEDATRSTTCIQSDPGAYEDVTGGDPDPDHHAEAVGDRDVQRLILVGSVTPEEGEDHWTFDIPDNIMLILDLGVDAEGGLMMRGPPEVEELPEGADLATMVPGVSLPEIKRDSDGSYFVEFQPVGLG